MNMHEKILDNLQELVYIADMETYELLYCNRALAEEFHIPQRLHGKCYEILQGRRDPCPFCTNGKLSQDGCYVWKFYNQLVGRRAALPTGRIIPALRSGPRAGPDRARCRLPCPPRA